MSAGLKISAVVATYNRADTLRQTLDHLIAQDLPASSFEVIVVDDGSTDHTGEVAKEAIARAPCRMRYLQHENRGPGHTQNRGMREAEAPLVLLMADDIFMTPGALRAHIATHRRHSGPEWVVLGNVLQSPLLKGTAFLRIWNPFMMDRLPEGEELPHYYFWACNISFKTAFMMQHGLFRDEMGPAGPAAHEDAELGYTLHRAGLRLTHSKAALGHHHHVETLDGTIQRSIQRGRNFWVFRDRVDRPELVVRYRVLALATLRDHFRALVGDGGRDLLGAEGSALWMPMRYGVRALVFNRLTIPLFWMPLFRHAERHRWVEGVVRSSFYRGVISHHFSLSAKRALRERVVGS